MFPKFLEELNPEVLLSERYAGLDFETTNLDKGRASNSNNRIVGWVGIDATGAKVYRKYYEREPRNYASLLSFVNRPGIDLLVAHNAKFELQWLQRVGMEPGSVFVWDTMVAEYVIAGNRRWDLSLDAVAARYGIGHKESLVASMIKDGICPSHIPERRLMDYCQQDVALTIGVMLKQRKIIVDSGLLPVLFTRLLTTLVLSDIELKGMALTPGPVKEEYAKCGKAIGTAITRLSEITGGINPRSPKQVGEYLYDALGFSETTDYRGNPSRTPAGNRKTDEDTVLALKPSTDDQQKFIGAFRAFSPLKKRFETLTKLNECIKHDAILLASFNQCVTGTHRLSSSGYNYKVQFQNIDRDFKRLFVPRHPGWQMGDSDAPQLEFRVAGDIADDPQALQDIRNKADVHSYTASILLNKAQGAITKSERTAAKSDTFKPLYGGKSGSNSQKKYYAAFQKKYCKIYKTQTKWTYEVLKSKKLRIPSGLILYWPHVEIYDSGYIKGTTEIFNYPIQSFATADIIPITLIYMWYLMRSMKSFIVNTVHDSIISEICPGEEDKWKEICKRAYTSDVFNYLEKVYKYRFTTPLGVSYNLGEYWGDGKEELFELDPGTF